MRCLSVLALITASLFIASCGSASKASADVVARVNGKDIMTAQLEKQFQNRLNGAEQPPSAEEAQDLKLQVLNQLINDQILLEMASTAGLSATDAEVDVKFNEFKSQYTEEKFKDLLKEQKMTIDDIDPRLAQAIQKMRPGETYPQVIETRFGFHIVKLMEKDAGGQKDLSEPRVQAQVRQVIFNRKDQTLKNAFSEAARNKATVVNYLAERILATAGKSH